LEFAAKVSEKRCRPVALMRGRRVEDDLVREGIEIGPDTPFETAAPLVEHRDRRVVSLEIIRGRDLATQLLANRRQGRRHISHPAAQGAPREIDALAGEDPREPMQRKMVDVLRDDHMGQQSFASEGFLQGLWGRRRFDDTLMAVRTGVFRADGFDDDETGRLVFELFGDVLPDARPRVTARALLVGVSDVDLDTTARQVRRQWPPSGGPAPCMTADGGLARIHLHRFADRSGLVGELLERELQLPRIHAFGFLAKQPLTQDVELMPQRGDLAL
jgi:hypothetical protein